MQVWSVFYQGIDRIDRCMDRPKIPKIVKIFVILFIPVLILMLWLLGILQRKLLIKYCRISYCYRDLFAITS